MDPQQSYGSFPPPPGGNPYDFITNPAKPPKPPKGVRGIASDAFVAKLILIVGGTVVFMIVAVLVVNLVFGSRTNLGSLLTLAQEQQEIVRVAALADPSISDQTITDAAISTGLTVTTQQQALLTYLSTHRQKVTGKQLSLKRDSTIDKRLTQARATSTFDIAFTQIVRQQLQDYLLALKTAHNNATAASVKKILADDYNQTQMLLKQWPSR